tara:strand:+ start:1161 stop:1421 length:261 start_codon:yes stop_codon:yes gene_type:complete
MSIEQSDGTIIPDAIEIARFYQAGLDSVKTVNDIIAFGDTSDESVYTMNQNLKYLKIMITRDYYTDEDMSAPNQAIIDGDAYLEGN